MNHETQRPVSGGRNSPLVHTLTLHPPHLEIAYSASRGV